MIKDKICPKCKKIFRKGDTVALSKEKFECCNKCRELIILKEVGKQ